MNIREYGVLFWTVVGVSALILASPALSRFLVYPRTEFFTELWLLDSSGGTEDYPFNITQNDNYTIYLGIGNRLGYCAYYLVQVKFANQTKNVPRSFGPIENRSPSSLRSLFNIAVFIADEQVSEIPLTFSFDYVWDESFSRVDFLSLRLNGVWLNMTGYAAFWDSGKSVFGGFLFFELWLYNANASVFQYHGRFVSFRLNMTVTA